MLAFLVSPGMNPPVEAPRQVVSENVLTHWRMKSAYHYNGVTYVGWCDSNENYKIATYTHATRTWSAATTIDTSTYGTATDHAQPSVMVIENKAGSVGHILYAAACYSADGGDLAVWRSDNSEDISAWTMTEQLVGGAWGDYHYPFLIEVTNGTVILFYRAADDNFYFESSADGGATWGASTQLTNFNTYPQFVVSGDEIHMMANEAVNPGADYTNIYHMYSADAGANWKWMDDTPVVLPAATGDLDEVFTTAGGEETRDCDLTLDGSGYPNLLFADDIYGTKTLKRSNWTGAAWSTESIIPTGHVGKTSEVAYGCFAPGDADTVYAPVEVGNGLRIVSFEREGANLWSYGGESKVALLGDAFRPIKVKKGQSDLPFIFSWATDYAGHDATDWGYQPAVCYP